MFSDKIESNFRNAFDKRESDHPIRLLSNWLMGEGTITYLSPQRRGELATGFSDPPPRQPQFTSALALLGAMGKPYMRGQAVTILLEFCRCWPELSQYIIGCEAETAWKLWCKEPDRSIDVTPQVTPEVTPEVAQARTADNGSSMVGSDRTKDSLAIAHRTIDNLIKTGHI